MYNDWVTIVVFVALTGTLLYFIASAFVVKKSAFVFLTGFILGGLAVAAMILVLAAAAIASAEPYVSASGGATVSTEIDDAGVEDDASWTAAVGVDQGKYRYEIEASHTAAGVSFNNVTSDAIGVGVYRDFPLGGAYTAFIGGGLGAAYTRGVTTWPLPEEHAWGVYAHADAGLSYALSPNLDLFGGVRYRYDEFNFKDAPVSYDHWESTIVSVGVRWRFGE